MSGEKSTHVSEEKKQIVSDLGKLLKEKKTILIASIKNIPASQFQEIGKKLRGKAIIKVPKKNLIFRAIDESGNDVATKLKEQITDSIAILFSDLDAFELAGELMRNKSPSKAKPGQEAPEDIEIQAGPTELIPGPAISELGALGIQVQIDKGKITIKEARVIAKEGQKISVAAAEIMAKLDIKPFSVGFIPLAALDTKEGKLYLDIKIDAEEAISKLKEAHGKALSFAVEVGYSSPDTIKFLIGKAHRHSKALEKLKPQEEGKKQEIKDEPKEESKQEEKQEEGKKEKTEDAPKEEIKGEAK